VSFEGQKRSKVSQTQRITTEHIVKDGTEAVIPHTAPGRSKSTTKAQWEHNQSITDIPHPDLQAVIDAWPALPDAVKAGIVAMVKASGE